MTHVKALQAGQSSQGTSEPITVVLQDRWSHHSGLIKHGVLYIWWVCIVNNCSEFIEVCANLGRFIIIFV